jgi:hypothetical protein
VFLGLPAAAARAPTVTNFNQASPRAQRHQAHFAREPVASGGPRNRSLLRRRQYASWRCQLCIRHVGARRIPFQLQLPRGINTVDTDGIIRLVPRRRTRSGRCWAGTTSIHQSIRQASLSVLCLRRIRAGIMLPRLCMHFARLAAMATRCATFR